MKMVTSGTGLSLLSAWFRRKATSRILVAEGRFPVFLLCLSCMRCAWWKVLDKELRLLPSPVEWLSISTAVSRHVPYSSGRLAESRRPGEQLFVVSIDVASRV